MKVSARSNSNLLLNAWEGYEFYKIKLTKEVSQETWDTEYWGERNHGVAPQRKNSCHGKTYLRLKEASSAANAHELLVSIGEDLKADSKARKIRIQRISSFLRWATSSQSDFILSSVSRTPPSKFSLSQYIGRKPKGIKIKFPHQKLH